ncbi:MAG: hypothetical protein HY695_01275, partial [Deltaproteobacteria bacterium]|nr:hypothetical protein [Deltaproteobacteria bacterium]
RPGALARLAESIGKQAANILTIQHVRGFGEIAIGETEVEMVLETTGWEHIRRVRDTLRKQGFRIKDPLTPR